MIWKLVYFMLGGWVLQWHTEQGEEMCERHHGAFGRWLLTHTRQLPPHRHHHFQRFRTSVLVETTREQMWCLISTLGRW